MNTSNMPNYTRKNDKCFTCEGCRREARMKSLNTKKEWWTLAKEEIRQKCIVKNEFKLRI